MARIEARLDDTVIVVWRDGELSGDGLFVNPVNVEAALMDGARLGPPEGPYSETDHLSTPLGFCLIVERVLPDGYELRGDLPAERDARTEDGDDLF